MRRLPESVTLGTQQRLARLAYCAGTSLHA